jgi:phosphatidylserine/phosphatidylglycerophosphate/cardiolipin synthase-like enzyme
VKLPTRCRAPWAATLVASAVVLAACSSSGSGSKAPTTATSATTPPVTSTTPVSEPSSTTTTRPQPNLTLAIEPADQYGSINEMIRNSRRTLDMTMYELSDPRVSILLAAAHRRGVVVRILLDNTSGAATVNQAAYNDLRSHGIAVRWGPSSAVFHQKSIVTDRTVAAIMTGNLTSTSYPNNRDFVVFDRSATAVRSIETVFDRDWSGSPTNRVATVAGLVWSPGARPTLVGLINSAHHTLTLENEEMGAPAIISALKAASHRGVLVTVTMTSNPAWKAAWTGLTRAGVDVATYPDTPTAMYIHAKAMVIDDLTAFVGSQNFSNAGLAHNRELGLITSDPAIVGPLSQTLASDFAGGTRFKARIPPVTTTTHTKVASADSTTSTTSPTKAP